jgi:4-alpha-glucanotransferase
VSAVQDALRRLEVDDLLLGVPDRCFPSAPDEDVGIGSAYAPSADAFLDFVRGLGFTGLQLGPQGETSEGNPSPYDGTLFARGRPSVSLARLATDPAWAGLVDTGELARLVRATPAGPPDAIRWQHAHRVHAAALAETGARFAARRAAGEPAAVALGARLDAFTQEAWPWLERDALYRALVVVHGEESWRRWPDPIDRALFSAAPGADERRARLLAERKATVAQHAFEQFVAHEQHAAFRARCRARGLDVWGDLQIGFSERDAWAYQSLFLARYAVGAPPSRTNPAGQPWSYPVLDPDQPEGVAAFVAARAEKMFAEFDGIRVDHPHGYVCPWVYRTDTPDTLAAVQGGARLFASPALPDHAALARFAIVRSEQLNADPRTARWADDWVVALDPEELRRYGRLFDVIVGVARARGRGPDAVACEVLSTCPYPLRRVLVAHGLGGFRITQKANLRDPADVYRTENAAPADWVMIGNHDTRPIWLLLDDWRRAGTLGERAQYLATRLEPEPAWREAFARRLADTPTLLAQAQLADLFASRARHVMVFFTDAFGLRTVYNQGGVVAQDNWMLRLASDWRHAYRTRLASGAAMNVPLALAMALRARGDDDGLVARLEALAEGLRRGTD